MNSRSIASDGALHKSLGEIVISGELSISDSSYYFSNPIKVSLAPGNYEIIILCEEAAGLSAVRELCVVRRTVAWRVGRVLGEVIIDFAQIALADRESCDRAFDAIPDEEMNVYYDQLSDIDSTSSIDMGGAVIRVVRVPNDGDNVVRELLSDAGDRVGVHISFGRVEG